MYSIYFAWRTSYGGALQNATGSAFVLHTLSYCGCTQENASDLYKIVAPVVEPKYR